MKILLFLLMSADPCGGFDCQAVELLALITPQQLGTSTLNDVWGWTDPQSGREYAVVGLSNGTGFVDITDPSRPVVIGRLPKRTFDSLWTGVKVYQNHAYIVADRAGAHGVQVFDLTQLRAAVPGTIFRAATTYFGLGFGLLQGDAVGSAHNVAINEESGFLYVVGSHTACRAGLHMVDVRQPVRPRFAGCFSEDGYTHDVQCVNYRGPDPDHRGAEICFASNEDTVTIVDVSNKRRPKMLSRTGYPEVAYTHQGWLTEDHSYFLVNDEGDEIRFGLPTRTLIWDVRDLERPLLIGQYLAQTRSTDHNLFIRGRYVFEANYRSGVRILDAADVAAGILREVGFFDVDPSSDAPGFSGTWGVYPFFPSGVIVATDIQRGLFILRPNLP